METSVLGPIVASQPSPSSGTLVTPFNTSKLVDYVTEILCITLGADRAGLESPGSLFHEDRYNDTLGRLNRYASEPTVALYAMKNVAEADVPHRQSSRQTSLVSYLITIRADILPRTPSTWRGHIRHRYLLPIHYRHRAYLVALNDLFAGYHQTPAASRCQLTALRPAPGYEPSWNGDSKRGQWRITIRNFALTRAFSSRALLRCLYQNSGKPAWSDIAGKQICRSRVQDWYVCLGPVGFTGFEKNMQVFP